MYKLPITNDISEMEHLEEFVNEMAEAFNLADDFKFQLGLALDEAVANVVMYAYPDKEGMPIHIEADGEQGKKLIIRIIDEGVEFNPLAEAPEVDTDATTEDREIGGLGIFLVKESMDDVQYERKDGKNILTMTKNLL
ncbi:MAG: ATP-binding protein [Paludibacteraceae bacterium]|nr:ATP-binding protein [Paludibacteraceae bacterium]